MLQIEADRKDGCEDTYAQIYSHAHFGYDTKTGVMTNGQEQSQLVGAEMRVFSTLLANPNIDLEWRQIAQKSGRRLKDDSVRTYVYNIREKLPVPRILALEIIEGVRGVGCRFNDEGKPAEVPQEFSLNGLPVLLFSVKREIVLDGVTMKYSLADFEIVKALIQHMDGPLSAKNLVEHLPPSKDGQPIELNSLVSHIAVINRNYRRTMETSDELISGNRNEGYSTHIEPLINFGDDGEGKFTQLSSGREVIITSRKGPDIRVPRLDERNVKAEKRAVEANMNPVPTTEVHPHHWILDEADGERTEAMCKHCHKTKTFRNCFEEDEQESTIG